MLRSASLDRSALHEIDAVAAALLEREALSATELHAIIRAR